MLIDKDKLKAHNQWWLECGDDDYKHRKLVFDQIVDAQPIVDAIPVAWIIRWSADHTEYGTLTIERLIEDWRNENTTNRGTDCRN